MHKNMKTGKVLVCTVLLTLLLTACGTAPVSDEPDRPVDRGSPSAAAESAQDASQDETGISDRFESDQREAEQAARLEAEQQREIEERAATEQAAQAKVRLEREAAEQAAREKAAAEAERMAAEEEARREAEVERQVAEEEARRQAEAQRLVAEDEARRQAEAERQAAEEEARRQAQVERAAAERAAAEARAGDQQVVSALDDEALDVEDEPELAEEASAGMADAQAGTEVEAALDPIVASSELEIIIPRTEENIARLGNDLTPMGSIRAGNADGTIPAWDGGVTREDWPAGYQPGDRHPDLFAGDEPLFTITAENYREYADRLGAGQIALFERYPETYYMKVYPTHRSASFPQRIYEATIDNAATGRLVANGEGVEDVYEGFPFPLAQNAYELMWNHKLKYKGIGGARYNNQVVPTASGSFQLIKLREELLGLYYKEGMTIDQTNNILLYFFQEVESPARLAGNILLVHETLNQLKQPRQAWIYNPGQRRVRRAPNVAYDNPGTGSDGLRTNDMTDMFNGAMDRYNWKIVDKKEMYIPYNSYRAHSSDLTPDDLVRPGHLNPEHMRYELHRVWIVDANLREGTRHIHPRRTFYLDEDSYQIALIDHYDQQGDIWRVSEAHTLNYYELPTYWSTILSHMDLQAGRYAATGLDNQDPVPSFNVDLSPSNYTPQALRTRGRR